MESQLTGHGGPNYHPCHYGQSKHVFRGPARRLDGDFVAVLGGSETFGQFVDMPFPDLLERALGIDCVNFGVANAGPDAFLADPDILASCIRARMTLVQVFGALNQSNAFYRVHPRHNDRFIAPKPALKELFPEVDFTEFHYTRHLLGELERLSPRRHGQVRAVLRATWTDKMRQLLTRVHGPVILLWIASRRPTAPADRLADGDPPYVTGAMVATLQGLGAEMVAAPAVAGGGLAGKTFDSSQRRAARLLPGPEIHGPVSQMLAAKIRPMI